MSADYYFFAPTGGRYQTVFRGTLPRRYSIRRSRWDNASTDHSTLVLFFGAHYPLTFSALIRLPTSTMLLPKVRKKTHTYQKISYKN